MRKQNGELCFEFYVNCMRPEENRIETAIYMACGCVLGRDIMLQGGGRETTSFY
jgi:hypothetical protein